MHGLNLKKTEAGTRPERLSSTNMGVPGLKKTEAGTRPERLSSTNMGVPGAWSQPEEDGGGDKDGALNLDQYGVPDAQSQPEEDGGGGTRMEHLTSTSMGSQMRSLNLKKTEAGTRPERLSSTNMGVPGAYGRSAYPQPIWGPRCVVST